MLIAEAADVQAAYPAVPASAVEHLLYALHRAVPHIEAGRHADGLAQLRADLAGYRGEFADLQALGVTRIFAAADRQAIALTLADLRLLRSEHAAVGYVVVGDQLAANIWARTRGVGRRQLIAVRTNRHLTRLLGLAGPGLVIVELIDAGELPAELAGRLRELVDAGAVVRPGTWRPGDGPDPDHGRPRLNMSGARPH